MATLTAAAMSVSFNSGMRDGVGGMCGMGVVEGGGGRLLVGAASLLLEGAGGAALPISAEPKDACLSFLPLLVGEFVVAHLTKQYGFLCGVCSRSSTRVRPNCSAAATNLDLLDSAAADG